MITPTCSRCRRTIPADDINVGQDLAYCRSCNLSYQLSVLTERAELESAVDLNVPPPGAWCEEQAGTTRIGATHRSLGTAIGTLAIALFWNGIVSVFVLVALAGTLRHLDVALPEWFPAPDMNGKPMGVGMVVFLWIFLLPFIAIGLAMITAFLSALGGRTEVRFAPTSAVVLTGIGPLTWRRRFEPPDVQDVRIEETEWRDKRNRQRSKTQVLIATRSGRKIRCGSMLTDERRLFLAAALRQHLVREPVTRPG